MSEIFFDLVFIFALTRVIAVMGSPPAAVSMVRGLVLLLLLWMSWTLYVWLSNRARADVGLVRAGVLLAMLAIFVIALVIPGSWHTHRGAASAAVVLALAYIALQFLHLALFFYASAGSRQSRRTLGIFEIAVVVSWVPLILGAMLGGVAQTVLWAAVFAIEYGGGHLASKLSGWQLRSPAHFSERHGLVVMIALGESLVAAGAHAAPAIVRWPELLAAVLGFVATVCLWWLYFDDTAVAAAKALEKLAGQTRNQAASSAYSLAHFPMIAGVIYFALGSQQVLIRVDRQPMPGLLSASLDWGSAVALYGGVALFLGGRAVFLALTVRSVPRAEVVAACAAPVLLPAGRFLPALVALGLLTALLVGQIFWERFRRGEAAVDVAEVTSV
ncbi:low temperature requirement protein A [Rugosimonospora africana]|uniref:Low temperature requirement protein A n=2 Tax=Rugosimonospora africana TaxID=556532 RepID=A0A8J3R148_9ACTN|nr:low temperature requirement protein A [Rugosimonospora africana]